MGDNSRVSVPQEFSFQAPLAICFKSVAPCPVFSSGRVVR